MMLVVFVVAVLVTEGMSQSCSHTSPCAFTGGDPFVAPPEQVSVSGVLNYELTVDIADITIEWLTTKRRAWNGQLGGPVLRMRKGDQVNINLVNNLMLPHKLLDVNDQRLPNSTNLHTHGLHISSQEPQDNVFVHLEPGETYMYRYQIDAENEPGTLWYHPHLHGSTLFQVHGGMAGMIVVEDPADSTTPAHIQAVSCPNNCDKEVRLLFQPVLQYSQRGPRAFATIQDDIQDNALFRHNSEILDAGGNLEDWLTANVNHFTTNGQLWPVLTIPAGEVRRFRMVNAGGGAFLELHIADNSDQPTTGCTVKQISLDGVYFDSAVELGAGGRTFLVPSGKADWLVVCNTPGTYHLRSTPDNADEMSTGNIEHYNARLLTLTVTGSTTTTTTIADNLPAKATFNRDFSTLSDDEVFGRFVIEASPGTRLNRERFSSNTDYRFKMEAETVQELYFVNSDSQDGHPIHIHINHFQIISYNPYTGPIAVNNRQSYVFFNQAGDRCFRQHSTYDENFTGNLPNNALQFLGHDTRWAAGGTGTRGYATAKQFHDVLLVPPLANITARFLTHTYTGEVVVHCHLLNHEDSGMMMTLEIVAQGADLTANTTSGNAYPGQCAECDPFPFNTAVCDADGSTLTTTTTVAGTSTTATTTGGSDTIKTTGALMFFAVLLSWFSHSHVC